ncbi:family 78 glycoside hydrolase catalytic domain [Aporhodopirellula aestuarii]|uniref:alpha-L-rhamnosidase n=1 Tax=Aporhodopirellula aestuarii TaxID=2950107 RepID=A0ABT0U3G1_9BACT|nr:glycoside hydrolase family 78 protein [Aporhodopirellula aestuarii]MCM2370988.1 glycoside hydrolase family 78 protein [Aporhodopirellula aestuarii]
MKTICIPSVFLFAVAMICAGQLSAMTPTTLRCEYLENPRGIDVVTPRLSWRVESDQRGQNQVAYQILVASSEKNLADDVGDLWDSGRVESDQTLFVPYSGQSLVSRQRCFWKVKSWASDEDRPAWSQTASWSMGLLSDDDWTAEYISYADPDPVYDDPSVLELPAARQYRKEFATRKKIARATIYSTALGIYELHLNGKRVGDALFAPGWTDYRQRAYYNTYDVTEMVREGDNAVGAWVADGWYSGYVGFGLLTGIGTEKTGRSTYGKTPSLMAQLEIHYTDGTRETVNTDASWKVSGDGAIEEADLLMGESYDARKEFLGWDVAGFDDSSWQHAVLAKDNGSKMATFYQFRNPEKRGQPVRKAGSEAEFGFVRPKLESFPGVPVRVTQEIQAKSVAEREPGTYVFDLGQNFAGVIRMKVNGPAGQRIKIRYAEMLHPDGRVMTENLRKARATDFYTCRGDADGEVYEPRFTFHGFQFVEVSNFPGKPTLDTITGLVLHSDTPMTSSFACSDPMVNRLYQNVLWTQRANFLDLPTDCPQRDERMGWTGDAQAYVATAAYNADIGAFYTKWLRELMESQRPSGTFPGYAPYPFQHGQDFGTAWADAGVICPWTIWQAYGDTRVIETCWEPMTKFMQWREETSVNDLGIEHGNAWGDWLAQGAKTPLQYIDTIYLAISARMMSEMADAIGRQSESEKYREQFNRTKAAFATKYLNDDGSVNIHTQTAQALALFADLIPEDKREATGRQLAKMLEENGNHMATGFLGTRPLLPVLSESGQHDLATFLLQSREFPSWGYEIKNGATTIWERWDSYTKEDAFGRHNAAMNSFSHYAFGAVCEWMFHTLAGIQSDGPGYKKIIIRPTPPSPGSNAMHDPIDWVDASYESIRGTIRSSWKLSDGRFHLSVSIPANTVATVFLPTSDASSITEGGAPIAKHNHVRVIRQEQDYCVLEVESGDYEFKCASGIEPALHSIATSEPADHSVNPEKVELAGAKKLASWDFTNAADLERWSERDNVRVVNENGKTKLIATGSDPKIMTTLGERVSGQMAIELRAVVGKGATSQFFWAPPQGGFSEARQSSRPLAASDQPKRYLFRIPGNDSVKKLRFDPFQDYDQYANQGEMEVESISIYQLAE